MRARTSVGGRRGGERALAHARGSRREGEGRVAGEAAAADVARARRGARPPARAAMAKKKKGGKKKGGKGKKSAGPAEPPHDPQWEGAVQARRWDRPPDALPDAALWPTWGAIR